MAVQNIFIAGMEKCGTTALADWMLSNGLVEDRVPDIKEPYLYANDEVHPARVRTSDLPLLDASIGYSQNPACVKRLPEYDSHIVICLRNPFERLWSAYKMRKLNSAKHQAADDYFDGFEGTREVPQYLKGVAGSILDAHRICAQHFPRRSHAIVRDYLNLELERIDSGTFASRIEYELGFYLSRKQFPITSILANSFYQQAIRNVQEKYLPSDISVVSVSQLAGADARLSFVEGVFEKSVETSEIPKSFSSSEFDIDEPKPDFNSAQFDLLRSCFRYDLDLVRERVKNTRFGDRFLDHADLDRYMAVR